MERVKKIGDCKSFKIGDFILFDNDRDSRVVLLVVEKILTMPFHIKKIGENILCNMYLMGNGEISSTKGMKFRLVFNFILKEEWNVSKLNKKESKKYQERIFLETL